MILSAHIGLSYICNMKCKHCFVSEKNDKVSVEDIKAILNDLKELGTMCLFYTYGEPLLWKNIFEVTRDARSKGFYQTLMSNGSLICDYESALKIKDAGVNQVYISLDSSNNFKHDSNRGFNGAFAKAINAINYINEVGIKSSIACTVNENNVNELYQIFSIAKTLNVSTVSFLRERRNCKIVKFNEDTYKKELEKIFSDRGDIRIILHDLFLNEFLKKLKNQGIINMDDYERYYNGNTCHAQEMICIEPSGDVTQCNLNPSILGNIKNKSLNSMISEMSEMSCY